MEISCACGKRLRVPDSLAGKQVKCPACAKVFTVPAAAPTVEKVIVKCACGQKLAAPASAAGKKIRCPNCDAITAVPLPGAPAAGVSKEDDAEFGLDLSTPPLPLPPVPTSDATTFDVASAKCPNCGAILEGSAQFCVGCGTNVATGSQAAGVDLKAMAEEKKDSGKTKWIAAIVVIAILALIAIGLAIVGFDFDKIIPGRSPDREETTESVSPDESSPPEETTEGASPAKPSQPEETTESSPAKPSEPKGPPKLGAGQIEKTGDEGYFTLSLRSMTRAEAITREAEANKAVKFFEIEYDRLPKDLVELKEFIKLQELTDGIEYKYDVSTGKIKIVNSPR